MKVIGFFVGLLISVNAFASVHLAWKQIQNSSRYTVDAPGTWFINSNSNAYGTTYRRFLSLTGKPQVCVAGDMIYGGTVKSCVKYATQSGPSSCIAKKPTELWAPITGTRTVCVEDNDSGVCSKTQTLTYTLTTIVTARIVDTSTNSASGPRVIGTKQMQLPVCQTTPNPPQAN